MGINMGLRLLTLGLSIILIFLISYYFLVVNRAPVLSTQNANSTINLAEAEKIRAEAVLTSEVKTALAQTRRLQGYNIQVEYKAGTITLSGEVPSTIDKELAASLALEKSGVKDLNNLLRVVPSATPQQAESTVTATNFNISDLELQANLQERVASLAEFAGQPITIKVQNHVVILSGAVSTEQQRLRLEQIIRSFPKVAVVNSTLKAGNNAVVKPTPAL